MLWQKCQEVTSVALLEGLGGQCTDMFWSPQRETSTTGIGRQLSWVGLNWLGLHLLDKKSITGYKGGDL